MFESKKFQFLLIHPLIFACLQTASIWRKAPGAPSGRERRRGAAAEKAEKEREISLEEQRELERSRYSVVAFNMSLSISFTTHLGLLLLLSYTEEHWRPKQHCMSNSPVGTVCASWKRRRKRGKERADISLTLPRSLLMK